jgi:ribonuclease P protein component
MAENTCGRPRLGVSVDRSCGSSVARNRLKRLAREVFRRQQHDIATDFDYLLIFSRNYLLIFSRKMSKKSKLGKRPAANRVTFEKLTKAFLESAARAARQLEG